MSVKFDFGPGISWYTRYRIRHMAEKMHLQSSRPFQVTLGHYWCYVWNYNQICIPHNFSWLAPNLAGDNFSLAHEFSHTQDKRYVGILIFEKLALLGSGIFCFWQRKKLKEGINSLEEKGIKRDTLLATGIISCLILLFLSTQTKNAFLRSGEEFADKNALKYISTKEKVKVIAQLTSYQLQGYPPDATHPSLEKRIEWVKESIGRENLLSRIYAKVLLCFFLPAMHTKLALKNMLEK